MIKLFKPHEMYRKIYPEHTFVDDSPVMVWYAQLLNGQVLISTSPTQGEYYRLQATGNGDFDIYKHHGERIG